MKVPVSWLREFVAIPEAATGRDVADMLLRVGFEVEGVDTVGDVRGQLVVGRVASIEELTEFKKPIRWCTVEVGAAHGAADTPGVRGIVCGARNFAEGDLVVVALPGTTLPGDFTIATRETYGHISDGMMCSPRELGISDDHGGLIILPADSAQPGDDAFPILGLGDEVLDIAITPDRGYALSVRGLAREVAISLDVPFVDPAAELAELPEASGDAVAAACEDSAACDLLVLHTLEGFDPSAPTPDFIKNRLAAVGVRSISLAVDVTNYVMFELGQPMHAFDADKVKGTVRARRAEAGEKLETLDHVVRTLDADDLVIADDSGALSLAGTMGGFATEISQHTTRIVLEAAHFDETVVAKMSRRHKLSSESSRRFERGVDRMLAPVAAARAAQLLITYGGAKYVGATGVETAPNRTVIAFDPALPSRVAGFTYSTETVERVLVAIGCALDTSTSPWAVRPPSWRPDLNAAIDLVEEVVRIDGFDKVPTTLSTAPQGRGLTAQQRLRRHVGVYLASRGLVEVRNYPFIGSKDLDAMGLEANDPRRNTLQLANPLSDEAPFMRSSLLPGLAGALGRNVSRGFSDVAVFELSSVCWLWNTQDANAVAPRVSVAGRPSDADLASLNALLPEQPLHAGAILTGSLAASGWWGTATPATWRDAIELVVALGRELGVEVTVASAQVAPWHPGRCAELRIGDQPFGHAGELAPRAAAAMGVPARSVAFEFNVDQLIAAAETTPQAPRVWTFPVALQDLALVVDKDVPAVDVLNVVRQAAGELLEDAQLFDVYEGAQVPEGKKSLAFALRFRASDRTLSAEEVAVVRQAVLAAVEAKCGAVLR